MTSDRPDFLDGLLSKVQWSEFVASEETFLWIYVSSDLSIRMRHSGIEMQFKGKTLRVYAGENYSRCDKSRPRLTRKAFLLHAVLLFPAVLVEKSAGGVCVEI